MFRLVIQIKARVVLVFSRTHCFGITLTQGQEKTVDTKLVKQFKEHRKHKASLTTNHEEASPAASPDTVNKNGNLRSTRNESNAAASRLSLTEMEKIVTDMKDKLSQDKAGTLTLKKKTKERYEKFISRYETLSAQSTIQIPQIGDAKTQENLAWYKHNKHKEEFMETRGLVLGKTKEEREEIAQHVRKELADHEAGVKTMDNRLYEVKKNALMRYDKVNHHKGPGTSMERVKGEMEETKKLHTFETQNEDETDENQDETEEQPGKADDSADGDEVTVSDGKTAEAIDPESLEAPPRNDVDKDDDDNNPRSKNGVIVQREEVKRRHENEVPSTREEKEKYREGQVGVKTSYRLHGDDDEREESE